jgi:hypothetical protein
MADFGPMRRLAALVLPLLAFAAQPAAAQVVVYEEVTEEIIEAPATGSDRVVEVTQDVAPAIPKGIARFGPFRVLDASHAALVDATDTRSPAQFSAMLHAWPGIKTLEMVECPGTDDDRANLRIGLMIHARGMATDVPRGGSVRSGAVELFLAGVRRSAAPDAEFAVHSWADEFGLEPKDYAANAPENRIYLDYYRQMGMADGEARAFYAMTNSVPNKQARWLTRGDMAKWVRLDTETQVDSKLAVN